MRFDALLELYKAESDTTVVELKKHIAHSDPIVKVMVDMVSSLNAITYDIETLENPDTWKVITMNKVQEMCSHILTLDHHMAELIKNCRNSNLKLDLHSYSSKLKEAAQSIEKCSVMDEHVYTCYGKMFTTILTASKNIVMILPAVYKACQASLGKRKKSSKKWI